MSAAPNLKSTLKFEIEVSKGPHLGLRLDFTKGSATIGRGPENDIVLSNDPRVSRQHAEIKQRDDCFIVVNLSAKNFILVDGVNVQSEVIKSGSRIQIGETEIHFIAELPQVEEAPPSLAQTPALTLQPSSPSPFVPLTPKTPVQTPSSTPSFQQPSMPASRSALPPHMSYPGQAGYGGYQPPPSSGSGMTRHGPPPSEGLLQNPKVRFYGIIAILCIAGWFIFSSPKNKNAKDPNAIRTSTVSEQDVLEAEKRSQDLLLIKKDKYDTVQYKRAQENFIRGFRDFQQGQYARAREAFQVVLNLDPDNELAKRYYHLSKIKFDELVKFNMNQGNRYREKRNWRMCQSNYSNVMTMLQGRRDDPSFKEAKQYYEECSLNLEGGRF